MNGARVRKKIQTMTTKAMVGWGGLLFPAVQQYRTIAVPVTAAYDWNYFCNLLV
jgi:hypothetical protein